MDKRRRPGEQRVHPAGGRRLAAALAVVLLAGCSSNAPTVCSGGFCSGPAHIYTSWDDLVFVGTWLGIVPVPSGTADGPARIVKPIRPAPLRIPGGY